MPWKLFLAAVLAWITGCAVSPLATEQKSGLAAVAGDWVYSHAGEPTVWEEGIPDPRQFADDSMRGCRISIATDGKASVLSPSGEGGSFTLRAAEESPLFIKLQDDSAPEKAWTYDKKTRRIIMPMELELPGKKGTMPAYFKRD